MNGTMQEIWHQNSSKTVYYSQLYIFLCCFSWFTQLRYSLFFKPFAIVHCSQRNIKLNYKYVFQSRIYIFLLLLYNGICQPVNSIFFLIFYILAISSHFSLDSLAICRWYNFYEFFLWFPSKIVLTELYQFIWIHRQLTMNAFD